MTEAALTVPVEALGVAYKRRADLAPGGERAQRFYSVSREGAQLAQVEARSFDMPPGSLALPFHLPLRAALVAALREVLAHAADQVERAATEPARAIYELRKSMRRARALVRVARPVMSRAASRRLDVALKQAHSAQSSLRDAEILADTLGGVKIPSAGKVSKAIAAHCKSELDVQRVRKVLGKSIDATRSASSSPV
jgi:inorganic triphosphatase YgiF